jgi:hypothetical protein
MVGERMSFQAVAEKKMEIDVMMWQIDMQSYQHLWMPDHHEVVALRSLQ